MTPFWNSPPIAILDRSNAIDDIAMLHALDRLKRMRACAKNLEFQSSSESYNSNVHHFSHSSGSLGELRCFSDDVACVLSIDGPIDEGGDVLKGQIVLRFSTASHEGATRNDTPLRIIDKWIEILSLRSIAVIGDLTFATTQSDPYRALRKLLIDVSCLIAAENPKRDPRAKVRMRVPGPGFEGALVSKSGKKLLRKAIESEILQEAPHAVHFEMVLINDFRLSQIEVSIQHQAIAGNTLEIMRVFNSSNLIRFINPLLTDARKPE